MLRTYLFCFTLLTGMTSQAQTTFRQLSTTEGFNVGLMGQYTGWASTSQTFADLAKVSSGGGGGIRVGYGFSQRLEPYVQADYSVLSNAELGDLLKTNITHLDAGLRFNFGSTTKRLRPYAEAALSYVRTNITNIPFQYEGTSYSGNLSLQGYGLTAAFGLNFFVTPMISLNVGYKPMLIGKFNRTVNFEVVGVGSEDTDLGEDIIIGTGRLSLGINLYLSGGK